MTSLRRSLPSLDHLEVFEVAGRLGSFGRAGKELGITQAAVSYAVRALEADLGQPLFTRASTGVRLTEAGARFHVEVGLALSLVRQSAERLRRGRGGGASVTLSVSTAVATWWVLPRLARLRADLPDIDLRVLTSDRDVDLRAEGLSLGVRYGAGVLPHYEAATLAPEIIYPACSPGFLARLETPPEGPEDLVQLPLIHLDEPHRPCPTWADWFEAFGVAYAETGPGLRLNDYALVVLAAQEGQGVILGWAHLIDPLVAAGALVRPIPQSWATGIDFMLVWSGEPAPQTRRVRDWLLGNPEPASPGFGERPD